MAERSIITDKVVVARTGATIEEWFRHLDGLGAQKLDAGAIYKLIQGVEGLAPLGEWNQGLLSTSYQWSRGLRERGEKKDGFEVSVSKTINAPLSAIYDAVVKAKSRQRWLPEAIEITKETPNKSARALWEDGQTRLSIDVYSKADTKARIVIQHLKIADSTAAAKLKDMWAERLAALKSQLEKN
jgi:hypothetical protein